MQAIAQTAIEGGAQWFDIEQDDHVHGEPMADMEKSIQVLKKYLEK